MLPHRITEFRSFYNTTLQPELRRLERLRIRLVRGIFLSLALVVATVVVFTLLERGFLIFFLLVPLLFYVGSLYYRIEKFRQAFKPAVMQLILEFLNESPNFRELKYDAQKAILRDRFERSGLFRPNPDTYSAEDYFSGMVGEMAFEMGEAYVREISPASNRLLLVFSGLFVHAVFNESNRPSDDIAVWPRQNIRRLKRTVDAYVAGGGRNADIEIHNPGFRDHFCVYAKPGTAVHKVLTEPIQDAMLAYVRNNKQDVFFSIHGRDLFIGLAHDYDMLEPRIWKSNLSFALIRQFYTDITLALKVIEDFDQGR